MVIYDDIILNKKLISDATDIFYRGRHMKININVWSQNSFFNCQFFRVISLNATHIVLFRMCDLKQISCYGKTLLTKNKVETFLILYKKLVLKQKYSYRLIVFTQTSEDVSAIRSLVANEIYDFFVCIIKWMKDIYSDIDNPARLASIENFYKKR